MTREEVIEKLKEYEAKGYEVPDTSLIKTDQQIAGIRKSAVINTGVLDAVAAAIKPGMNTQEIDDIVANYTHEHGAICAPYHYEGFPKHVCTSINHEVCHGIPSRLKHLKDGDIVNVDVSTILDGYYSDASRMFAIGSISNERKRLIEATEKVLQAGIAAAKPWHTVGDIGAACEAVAKQYGYSIVRELGGHGCGNEFHEDPFVAHYGKANTGMLLVPGMIITIEPMVNAGKNGVYIDALNNWTIYTQDHKDSAQIEHMILITEDGNEILTA